jgi:predicted Zn-dependent protease with MMP-like domain
MSELEEERRALEARARGGDKRAWLDLAALALDHVSDDDDAANVATAKLVREAVEACRGDAELAVDAFGLVAEGIIAWARAWPEKETLALAERELGKDHELTFLLRGLLAFFAARWDDAALALDTPVDDPVALHYRACALERLGRHEEADRAYARAAEVDPIFAPPIRMSDADFRSCVETALAEIPEEIRSAIKKRCSIVVEDFPKDVLVREGMDPLALGLFSGADLGEEATGQEEVILYKKNLESLATSREELVGEIRTTLLHEVGHALGFDEEGVDDLGLA